MERYESLQMSNVTKEEIQCFFTDDSAQTKTIRYVLYGKRIANDAYYWLSNITSSTHDAASFEQSAYKCSPVRQQLA